MNARVLAVEDNPIQAKILCRQLQDHYEVELANSGEACLEKLAGGHFDLVVLDVNLPGMSGYEVCRRIKATAEGADLPVIFASVNCDMEDRLKGFEVGGFDYLVKPIVHEELLKKLNILMEHQEERKRLQSSADFAVSTAMTAMTSAAEQGLVLQFMKSSFACKDHRELADAIIGATNQFGLQAMVQIRSHYGTINRSHEGPCTPLEESVLRNISGSGRIVDLRQRTAINFERVSVLVKNMPTDDQERYGRFKDHLTMLVEGADSRVLALDMDMYLASEARKLIEAVKCISGKLVTVNQKTHDLHASYGSVFNRLAGELEQIIPLLEIYRSQESMLEDLLRQTSADYIALASKELEVDHDLHAAMDSLQQIAPN